MSKCKDCKYLDFSQKTSVGYICTNTSRRMNQRYGGYRTLGHIKEPNTKACKSGFEPREKRGAGNE